MALVMIQFTFQSNLPSDKVLGEGQILIFFAHQRRHFDVLSSSASSPPVLGLGVILLSSLPLSPTHPPSLIHELFSGPTLECAAPTRTCVQLGAREGD